MELRHLKYFVAVSEALSFNKAAARLRVAQPALSRQVAVLEEGLGAKLLHRSPRGVVLTAEGHLFLAEAREILGRMDEAVEKVRALARGRAGQLHVGYASALTVELVPPALATFQRAFPGIEVVLHDVSRDAFLESMQRGDLDLGVIPAMRQVEGVSFEFLRSYPVCVALPPGHPLVRCRSVSLEKASVEPLVGLRRRDYPGLSEMLDRIFSSCGKKLRLAVECDTPGSLIAAVEAGRGIALIIPPFRHVSGRRLLYRPLTGTEELFPIGVALPSGRAAAPAAEAFVRILRQVAARGIKGSF